MIVKCFLPESQKLCFEITVLARLIAECLEIKIVSAVNQICRFVSKFIRKLTVACNRHPMEKARYIIFHPRSQGLSSYRPLKQTRRDPGTRWSHVSQNLGNGN